MIWLGATRVRSCSSPEDRRSRVIRRGDNSCIVSSLEVSFEYSYGIVLLYYDIGLIIVAFSCVLVYSDGLGDCIHVLSVW